MTPEKAEIPRLNVAQNVLAETIYMNALLNAAKNSTYHSRANLSFDPQGRVLIDVSLDEQVILQKINTEFEAQGFTKATSLEQAIGRKPSAITTVSLDINNNQTLKKQFHSTVEKALLRHDDKITPERAQAIVAALDKTPKGSMIALQQEFHFHLALASRVYSQTFTELNTPEMREKIKEAHNDAMRELNIVVMQHFSKALDKAYQQGSEELNVRELNLSLDKSREQIQDLAHIILRAKIQEKTSVEISPKEQPLNGKTLKHHTKTTTATRNDILQSDNDLGMATLIQGSDISSHNRKEGLLANRQLSTRPLDAQGLISQNQNARQQIRVPSLDVKENISKEDCIKDIKSKISTLKDSINFSDNQNNLPKAMIYNLYTATESIEEIKPGETNKQTQGVIRILEAAHLYNKEQLKDDKKDPVLCFVQNISVNGFGKLDPKKSPLIKECVLMSEMALLHTLAYDNTKNDSLEKVTFRVCVDSYKAYLSNPARDKYFSQSEEGKKVIELINQAKQDWKNSPQAANDNVLNSAKAALKNLIAHDLHHNKDYAKLIQSLSVFIEPVSIGGCKSANERAQMINGRVAILDTLLNRPDKLNTFKPPLESALKNLASAQKNIEETAKALNTALNQTYDAMGEQSAMSLVALADMGATSKVQASDDKFMPNTNKTEAHTNEMPNLSQKYSGDMQSHKGASKSLLKACNIPFESAKAYYPSIKDAKNITFKESLLESIEKLKQSTPTATAQIAYLTYLHDKIDHTTFLKPEVLSQHIANGELGKGTVNLKTLLGEDGVKLFLSAVEEETAGDDFFKKLQNAAQQKYDCGHLLEPIGLVMAGASCVGKSTIQKHVFDMAASMFEQDKTNEANNVSRIDGGDIRESSDMRGSAINFALKSNHTGVGNIYKLTKSLLNSAKDKLAEAIFKSKDSIVIPETFSTFDYESVDKLIEKFGDNAVFCRIMTDHEDDQATIAFNGEQRAWGDPKSSRIPESKAYEGGMKYHAGNIGSKHAEDYFRQKNPNGHVMLVRYDLMLAQKNTSNGKWEAAKEGGPGVISVSRRNFKAWQKDSESLDLDTYDKKHSKKDFPIITTREQINIEKSIDKLQAMLAKDDPIVSSLANAEKLNEQWRAKDWSGYQTNLNTLRSSIEQHYAATNTLPSNVKNQLKDLYEQLDLARTNVPAHQRQVTLESTNTSLDRSFILKEDDEINDVLFSHEKIAVSSATPTLTKAHDTNSNPSTEPLAAIQQQGANNITYKAISLKEGELIRFSAQFSSKEGQNSNDNVGILTLDSKGKVSDITKSQSLSDYDKAVMAVEQAKIMLTNYKPELGAIILKGKDPEQSNRVLAALLMLKPNNDIKIKSFVAGCDVPKAMFQSSAEKTFIKTHLPPTLIKEDLLQAEKKEVSDIRAKTKDYRSRIIDLRDEKPKNTSEIKEDSTITLSRPGG